MPARPDSRGLLAPLLLVLLAALFAGFLAWLLAKRVGTGDIYPAYSSLRADPLGTKALFLAISDLPGVKAERNLQAWHRFDPGEEPTTILCLGSARTLEEGLPLKEKKAMLAWLRAGHRVVLTFPTASAWELEREKKRAARKPATDKDTKNKKENNNGDIKDTPDSGAAGDALDPVLSEPHLFCAMARPALSAKPGDILASSTFPPLAWHGSHVLAFPDSTGDWVTRGTVNGEPVLASRAIGAGELVVYTDTTFASNEGVWKDRQSSFILALIGGNRRVVFDERLLGTSEEPGIMTMLRRFHLHGLLVGGALLLLLLAWQGFTPLVPANPAREYGHDANGATAGRDATDGLVALLQRGLPAREILAYCLQRREQSRGHAPAPNPADLQAARSAAANASPGNLARAYQTITSLLHHPRSTKAKENHGNP